MTFAKNSTSLYKSARKIQIHAPGIKDSVLEEFLYEIKDYHRELAIILGSGAVIVLALIYLMVRRRARRRAEMKRYTLDMLANYEINREYQACYTQFVHAKKLPGGLNRFEDPEKFFSAEGEPIRIVLRRYDLIALSTEQKILDRDMVSDFEGNAFVSIWEQIEPFIKNLRGFSDNKKLFSNLENFARKEKRKK